MFVQLAAAAYINTQFLPSTTCTYVHAYFFFAQNKQIAQIYLLIMKRILEKDTGFIGAERVRLQSLLEGKISERNRLEMEMKLNVLSAFIIVPKKSSARNEL